MLLERLLLAPLSSLQLRSHFPFSHQTQPQKHKHKHKNKPKQIMNNQTVFDAKMATPLLLSSSATSSSFSSSRSSSESDTEDAENRLPKPDNFRILGAKNPPVSQQFSYKSLAVLAGHAGTVSCLALCGEFLLSASQANDIIVWQQPDLKPFARFGRGEGSVKALAAAGNMVFTAHQDSRIRVWKVSPSRASENVFRLADTLPTRKDYLGKFMSQRNYVQTRRHHKKLWIEHADSISCLAIDNGLVYSGSWDKTLKVWRLSDLKCLESIKAHDDAINGLVACKGLVYSASADGKVKAWAREARPSGGGGTNCGSKTSHCLKGILEGHKDVSVNAIAVSGDGKWVFGGASDGFLMGWEGKGNGEEWRVVCEVRAHAMAVLSVCLVGEFLCSGSADKSIGVWKRVALGGLCKVGVVCGHQGPIKCLQASPSGVGLGHGFLLYSGSLDKSLRVWWVPTKESSSKEGVSLEAK